MCLPPHCPSGSCIAFFLYCHCISSALSSRAILGAERPFTTCPQGKQSPQKPAVASLLSTTLITTVKLDLKEAVVALGAPRAPTCQVLSDSFHVQPEDVWPTTWELEPCPVWVVRSVRSGLGSWAMEGINASLMYHHS